MTPDLIITWTKHCDYPIFRRFLRNYRDFFGKVIIYFSEHNRFPYFDHFIHESLKDLDITFLDSTFTDWENEDWRNHATNEMLKHSTSDWVCSIEQDWFTKDWNQFFTLVNKSMQESDMFGWWNVTNHPYIHPAFWYIKRELLNKTSKDFFADPDIDGADHFGTITYEAEKLKAVIHKYSGECSIESEMFHQGGINQNYLNFRKIKLHRPNWFYIYNYWSMRCNVPMDFKFMQLMKKVDIVLRDRFPEIDPKTDERKIFYE